MVKKSVFAVGLLLAAALVFMACDDFYSTSWGKARDYDVSKINLSLSNLDTWMDAAVGNPELAAALTEKIKGKVAGVSPGAPTAEEARLMDAGVSLAIEASGIGATILTNAEKLTDLQDKDKDNAKAAADLLKGLQSDFSDSGGVQAAVNLAEIANHSVPDPAPNPPKFEGAYAENAKPSDVCQAIIVLTLAIIDKPIGDITSGDTVDLKDLSEYGLVVSNGRVELDSSKVNPETKALATALSGYLNLIADDPPGGKYEKNPITSGIKGAFGL